MKKEEIKKQDELKDEQLDYVGGGQSDGKRKKTIRGL